MRWVLKAPFEVLGRGGWISRVRGGAFGAGQGAGGRCALGGEEEGASSGDCASAAGFSDDEVIARRGSPELVGEEKGKSVAGGRALICGSSYGGEEGTCNRGRFAVGDKAYRVGEGELEAKGRFR